MMIPMEAGRDRFGGDIVADYYDLASGAFARTSDDEITLFKNGGGAHLDLMCARYILDAVQSD
jgi:ornithine cyclodeaminase